MLSKLASKLLLAVTFLATSSSAFCLEASMDVSWTETQTGLQIHGTTNLPDGTKLGVNVEANGYSASDFKVFVKSGGFSSNKFTKKGQSLAGNYQVTVFTVKNSIWHTAANLKQLESYGGELVSDKRIEKTVEVSLGSEEARIADLEQQSLNKQRFNKLAQMTVDLIGKGKEMDRIRNRATAQECGVRMRELQPKAKSLRAQVDQLPGSYEKMSLGAANSVLTLCVSCSESLAMSSCKEAEGYLREAGIL